MPAGRPRSEHPRVHVERVRTTDTEHAQLLAAATAEGLPLGPWLRQAALRAAKRTLRKQS